MNQENGSRKWQMTVRIIVFLIGIIELITVGWVRYISNRVDMASQTSISNNVEIRKVQEDVTYIRNRLDSLFELKRR